MESKRGYCNGFQSLAPEVISEILARLPIEWIMVCKSVCKTWYSLINNNYFVKLQLSKANDRPSSRVIFEPSIFLFLHGVNKRHLLDVEDGKVREIPGCPLADMNYDCCMNTMCTLDGLICLAPCGALNPVVICNPLITGDCIILPKTDISNVCVKGHHITLGFDPAINKYKAVRMLNYCASSFRYSLCEVITIGEESSWRRVVSPFAGLIHQYYRGGVFHQGSIYWIIDKFNVYNGETSNRSNREYILEFDVTNEVFRTVSFPHSMRVPKYRRYSDHLRFNMQLQIFGVSLALMEKEGRLLKIWRLVKQNGNPVVVYSSIRIETPYKYATILALLCPNGTDDFLLLQTYGRYEPCSSRKGAGRKKNQLQFTCYYPSKKNDRFVNLPSPQIASHLMPLFYLWCFKPSLISIKAASLGHL